MITNGDTMGVARQIIQHMFRTAERRFCVDNPLVAIESSDETSKLFLISQVAQMAIEVDLMLRKRFLKSVLELAAKHTAQHIDVKKEAR